MNAIEKTKLQFDLQRLNDRIQGTKCNKGLKRFAEDVIDRAEKAMDDEPINSIHGWEGKDL